MSDEELEKLAEEESKESKLTANQALSAILARPQG